jgi:predicted AAA+ superfamily ATPase
MSFIRGSHLPEQPMIDISGPRSPSPFTAQPISDSLADKMEEELMQLLPEDVRDFLRWLNSHLKARPSIEERVVLAKLFEEFIATGQVPERWHALIAKEAAAGISHA